MSVLISFQGKRTWRNDRKILLCNCSICREKNSEDPITKETVKGVYLGRNEYYEHASFDWARTTDDGSPAPSPGASTSSPANLPPPSPSNVPTCASHPSHPPAQARPSSQTASPDARRKHLSSPGEGDDGEDLAYIQSLSDALIRRSSLVEDEHRDLVFLHPPHAFSETASASSTPGGQSKELNTGHLELIYDESHNTALLEYEQWLVESYVALDSLTKNKNPKVALNAVFVRYDFGEAVMTVERWKMSEWDRQRTEAHQDLTRPTYGQPGERARVNTRTFLSLRAAAVPLDLTASTIEPYVRPAIHRFEPILLLCYLIVAVIHFLCGVSIKRCGWLLTALQDLLSMSYEFISGNPSDTVFESSFGDIISAIPADVRTVEKHLAIAPKTKPFVCCPACFACYSLGNAYPDHCTATLSTGLCGTELRKTRTINGRVRSFPARLYVYHDFKDWLARLLCRPGMEALMDRTLVAALDRDNHGVVDDFYDTETLTKLEMPDHAPFITPHTSEGRYVFSICMDGFMPTGKGGSASVSVGAIYLACMNLPASIRYREENLYLCSIIPGPKHPSQEMINPLLASLVDDFLALWYHGTRYTQTPHFPEGRVVRCMVGPLVADMLAARQMAGFSGHGSDRFCSFCLLSREHIENLDFWNWPLRSWDEQRAAAEQWRMTDDPEERARIMREQGIRWSELFRLPYWNPLIFTAIDPMHALFLGLLHRHCEIVWGMSSAYRDGLEGRASDPAKLRPAEYEMHEGYTALKTGSDDQLDGLPKEVLKVMCKELKLRFNGRKAKLCSRLRDYVGSYPHVVQLKA